MVVTREISAQRRSPKTMGLPRLVDSVLDRVHYLTALFAKPYFRNDPLSEFDFVDLEDILFDASAHTESLGAKRWDITARLGTNIRTARIHWASKPEPGKPILIYHHGAGSIPFDKTFRKTIRPATLPDWNIGCIEADCHQSLGEYFDRAFDSLESLQLLFASSILAQESVSRWATQNGSPTVAFTGVSMGGVLTALHMCYFGSGHLYLPMLCGLDLHHVFFFGSNRPLAHRIADRGRLDCYRRALDFSERLALAERRPCFPLLAEHDKLMDFDRSMQNWKNHPISTIKRGHTSGVMAYKAMTEHILTHLPKV